MALSVRQTSELKIRDTITLLVTSQRRAIMSANPDYLKEMSYLVIYSLYELFIVVCNSFNNKDSFHALFKLNEISKTENVRCEKIFDYHGFIQGSS